METNKDQIIYQLRQQIPELESKIDLLEQNVRQESIAKYELMKRIGQKDHEAPKT